MSTDSTFAEISGKGVLFYVSPVFDRVKFENWLPDMDSALGNGKLLKNSRSTTAAALSADFYPGPLFLKRTNRKGLPFILKYLFRRARSFRAAEGILQLMKAGIPTPRLLAWGEKRSGGLLKAGYLLTEFLPGAKQADHYWKEGGDPAFIIEGTASLLAAVHSSGIFHGDCKLPNFYVCGGRFGVWDLDGAEYYENGVPREKQLRDLGRLAWSCRKMNCVLPDEQICTLIAKHCPPETKICRHCVAKAMQEFAKHS